VPLSSPLTHAHQSIPSPLSPPLSSLRPCTQSDQARAHSPTRSAICGGVCYTPERDRFISMPARDDSLTIPIGFDNRCLVRSCMDSGSELTLIRADTLSRISSLVPDEPIELEPYTGPGLDGAGGEGLSVCNKCVLGSSGQGSRGRAARSAKKSLHPMLLGRDFLENSAQRVFSGRQARSRLAVTFYGTRARNAFAARLSSATLPRLNLLSSGKRLGGKERDCGSCAQLCYYPPAHARPCG
jgi:hypothetical protein